MFRSKRSLSEDEHTSIRAVYRVLRDVIAEASLPGNADMVPLQPLAAAQCDSLRDKRKRFKAIIFSTSSWRVVSDTCGYNEFCDVCNFEKRIFGNSRTHLLNVLEVVRNRFAQSYMDRRFDLPRADDVPGVFAAVTSRKEPHILFAALQTLEEATDGPHAHTVNPLSSTAFVEIVPWILRQLLPPTLLKQWVVPEPVDTVVGLTETLSTAAPAQSSSSLGGRAASLAQEFADAVISSNNVPSALEDRLAGTQLECMAEQRIYRAMADSHAKKLRVTLLNIASKCLRERMYEQCTGGYERYYWKFHIQGGEKKGKLNYVACREEISKVINLDRHVRNALRHGKVGTAASEVSKLLVNAEDRKWYQKQVQTPAFEKIMREAFEQMPEPTNELDEEQYVAFKDELEQLKKQLHAAKGPVHQTAMESPPFACSGATALPSQHSSSITTSVSSSDGQSAATAEEQLRNSVVAAHINDTTRIQALISERDARRASDLKAADAKWLDRDVSFVHPDTHRFVKASVSGTRIDVDGRYVLCVSHTSTLTTMHCIHTILNVFTPSL